MPAPDHIIIIGAGVTGLQTAISLLTSPSTSHFKITLIAAHLTGPVKHGLNTYSSPSCGGYWHSQASLSEKDAKIREWDQRTYEHWSQLLNGEGEENGETYEDRVKKYGLGFKDSQYYWLQETPETEGHDGSGIWFKDVVKDFEVVDLINGSQNDDKLRPPPGAVFGIRYKTICINTPRYLEYLMETALKLGATTIAAELNNKRGLDGIVLDAKAKLREETKVREEDIFAVINCAGERAKYFLDENESAKLRFITGQTLLVKGETEMAGTVVGFPEEWGILYIIPRPGTGMSVLGGSRFDMRVHDWDQSVAGNWNATMQQRMGIWGFAREISIPKESSSRLKSLHFDIGAISKRVGGPRVQVEGKEKVEGVWVVHSYGHNESGFQNSVGCAEKIVRLIAGL
ncbi:nucleotide-binding domain-containing protein [Hyaloscypha variabilis F]|uniref:Nucleotide-binding domain-containing protein n=1 Tax=Hyaloscypha variabilis (strain UAMH 11265 / GT02V1 / F) TaxID=1149755 RepID=A0A2J6RZL7_HYAVF|nr:nucleotide-binding domain-containing protein [Hyaloscypha variabilis F]